MADGGVDDRLQEHFPVLPSKKDLCSQPRSVGSIPTGNSITQLCRRKINYDSTMSSG